MAKQHHRLDFAWLPTPKRALLTSCVGLYIGLCRAVDMDISEHPFGSPSTIMILTVPLESTVRGETPRARKQSIAADVHERVVQLTVAVQIARFDGYLRGVDVDFSFRR